jgi:hypothetical protein
VREKDLGDSQHDKSETERDAQKTECRFVYFSTQGEWVDVERI